MSADNRDPSNGLTRRQFVKAAGASGAMALAGSGVSAGAEADQKPAATGPSTKLPTRVLGKTGLRVSVIGYGSYNLSNPRLLDNAISSGITLIETAADYQNGTAERTIGEVMARKRKQVILGTGMECSMTTTSQQVLREIDRSLQRLKTDYLDLWRVHYCNNAKTLKNEAIYEAFDKAKQAGKVLHLGVSTHNSLATGEVVQTAIDAGKFEFLMAKYNFMELPKNYVPFKNAVDAGMGCIAFKVSAGKRDDELADLQRRLQVSGEQAKIKWALGNSNVASVLSGARSFETIQEACQATQGPLSRAEQRYLDAYAEQFKHEYCRYCGACVASCPHGVQVDAVMRFAMYFKYYRAEKAAMQEYASLPIESRASRCDGCEGHCMRACPNGVRVQHQLTEAHELLTFGGGTNRYA
jgi:predicted aldo/keto reductase-like oxidoreductase